MEQRKEPGIQVPVPDMRSSVRCPMSGVRGPICARMRAVIAARLLLIVGVLGVVGAVNALSKPGQNRPWPLRPWWMFAMLTSELIPIRFVVRALLVVVLARFGALDHGAGRIGLALIFAGWLAHSVLLVRAMRARRAMADAVDSAGIPAATSGRIPLKRVVAGNPYRMPAPDRAYRGHRIPARLSDGPIQDTRRRPPARPAPDTRWQLARRQPETAGKAAAARTRGARLGDRKRLVPAPCRMQQSMINS